MFIHNTPTIPIYPIQMKFSGWKGDLHGITNAAEAVPLASAIPEITGYCRIAPIYGTLFYRPGERNITPAD
jgi:hypothetical protein